MARRGPAQLGAAEVFFTLDFRSGDFVTVEAELRGISPTTFVYVESSQWGVRVGQSDVDRVLVAFDQTTPEGSVSPGEGIARIIESRFGPPSDIDEDGRVHILILDIRDGYQEAGSYVSGYYTSHDQTRLYGSNQRDLIYIDCNPADPGSNNVLGTVAHEYQHLVHHRQDADESVFVNEGLSEYSTYLCGYGLRSFSLYLTATDVPLDSWSNVEADYSRVLLWTLYLGEQLGENFIRELFRAPANGVAGITSALAAIGSPRSFAALLADWFVANAVNDRALDPRFGYRATSAIAVPRVEHRSYPAAVSAAVSQLATDVIRFRNIEGLTLRFDGAGVNAWAVRRGPEAPVLVEPLAGGESLVNPEEGGAYDELLLLPHSVTMFGASYQYLANAAPGRVREIAYDDGESEQLAVLDPAAGSGVAVRFTPEVHRALLRSARFYVADTTAFEVHVWNDRGLGGMPGSNLIPPIRTRPEHAPGFHDVDLGELEVEIDSGDFYIGAIGLAGAPLVFALDGNAPIDDRSVITNGGDWRGFPAAGLGGFDLMVRTEVEYDDSTPPVLRIGLLQHPLFSEQADIYVAGDEPLSGASLHGVMRFGGATHDLTLAAVGDDGRLFVDASVLLGAGGEGEVEVSGTSRYGSQIVTARLDFAVGRIGGEGGSIALGGRGWPVVLDIPAGVLADPDAITLQRSAALAPALPGLKGAVTLGPGDLALARPASLAIAEVPDGSSLMRFNGSSWERVPGAHRQGNEIVAPIARFGTYAVIPTPPAGDFLRIVRVTPQPFNEHGMLELDLPQQGRIEVRLFDVSGRLRAVLFDGLLAGGRQLLPLDLGQVSRGPYLLQVTSGKDQRSTKIVTLR